MKIRIAIAEDNDTIAKSLIKNLKENSNEIEVIFRASNGFELLDKLNENNNVDIILMDIEMPVMDGIQATFEVKKKFPKIRILMLTVFDDDDKIFKSIQNGASGYLLKDESPETIVSSIKMIHEGGAMMSPSIALKILKLLKSAEIKNKDDNSQTYDLSVREIDVLKKMKEGKDYKQIADELFISPSTVRKHIENIYLKLQVHNKIQAVQKAIDNKII